MLGYCTLILSQVCRCIVYYRLYIIFLTFLTIAMYPAISTRWRSRNHALPPRSRHIYCALAARSPLVSSVTCLQCSFRQPYRIHARRHPVWQSRQSIKRGTAAGGEGKSIVFCQSRSPVPCRPYPPSAEDGQLPRSVAKGVTVTGGEGNSQSRSVKACF
jgi:hypothetical protein